MSNIKSDAYWSLIEGSTDDDTITLTGKSSTVQAYRGNDLIQLGNYSWTGDNLVYAGAGNDTIKINSSATVYGDAGADYFGVYGIQGSGGNLIMDGGAGADYFYLDTSSLSKYLSYTISNTTITAGDGSDTIRINPAVKNISAVITDFSAEDVFINDTDDVAGEFLTYSEISNGVVLQDYDPNTFSVTLKGVSISNIATAKYYYQNGSKTFGEIFGISASGKNISNTNDNTQITGTSYADTISTKGTYVTVSAGAGNDSIENRHVDIFDDTDRSYGNFFDGGSGNDTITVYYNYGSAIYGGDGDDSIVAYNGWLGSHINQDMKIYGGAGNDTITFNGKNSTFYGGTGNDVISLSNTNNQNQGYRLIVYESGNDTIYGFLDNDTLSLGGGYYTRKTVGNDVVISLTSGSSITVKNGTSIYQVNIVGGNETVPVTALNVTNSTSYKYIEGTSYEDTIVNLTGGWGSTIYGNGGADSITDYSFSDMIYGGDGNDTILNIGEQSYLYGNAGDDFIYVASGTEGRNTIYGGAGNDTVSLGGGKGSNGYYSSDYGGDKNLIIYNSGDGNDIIYNFYNTDTLQVAGAKYTTTTSGNNLIVGVGSGSITVSGGANVAFKIDGTLEGEEDTTPAGWKFTSTLATATLSTAEDLDLTQDYGTNIKNVNASITSGGVQIFGNNLNNSIRAGKGKDLIAGGAGNDTVSLGAGADTYIYSGGNDLIQDYATVDVIQIDTENGVEVTNIETVSSNVVIETSEGNITLKSGKGKNIALVDSEGNDIEINPDDLFIAGGAGADNISNTLADATIDAQAGNDNISNEGDNVSISGGADRDKIINDGYYATINGGAGVDTIENYGDYNIYQYVSGDGNDTIIGFGENDTLTITGGSYSYSVSGSDFIVKVGSSTIKLVDAAEKIIHINNETIPPEPPLPEGWKYGTSSKTNTNAAIITATVSSAEKEIDLNEAYGDGVEKVDAAKISDSKIIGNDLDNSIKTGAGNDELDGGYGNDTLTGGKGDDIFIYSGGDDVITDYGTGADSIQIDTNYIEFTAYETLKSDVIYTTNEGTLTIKNAIKSGKLKDIILMDEGGEVIIYPETLPAGWKYSASSNSEIVATIKSASDIDLTENYGADIEIVDGSSMNGGVILGNDLDNSIKGGAGNNTLGGGAGNDTLVGNTGADVYVYSEGDDRIINYVGGKDSIQIDVDNISAEKIQRDVDGEDVIFYIDGAGELTVQNAKDQKIKLMDANGKEIILDTLPRGWKFDSAKNLLQATVASADNEIDLTEEYGENVQKVDGSKITAGVYIYGNDSNNSIKGGKGTDEISGGSGNDTVSLGAGDDLYIYGGGDDVIQDYAAGHDSIQIDINEIEIYSAETVGNDVFYYTDAGNIKVIKGSGKDITLIDMNGDEIIIDGKTLPDGWKFGTTSKTNTNAEIVSATVKTAENIDLTENYGAGVVSINAATVIGGIEIIGNDNDNSIKGGKGGDTISGGGGNDTVSLGAGADVYIYQGGDDYIINYAAGKDSIQIDTAEIEVTGVETSGNDIIYETSAGNIKIVKGNGKNIILMDTNGDEIIIGNVTYPEGWKFDTAKGLLQATIASAVDEIDLTENYGAGVEKVDGSKITSGVVIYGSDDNISIKGSKGADTISGGTGNDTVSLGGGSDVYIYNGGNDLIQDYATVDAIQIDTNEIEITGIATVSTNKVIETSEGNITLKSAKTKNITLLDADGEEISFNGRIAENVWFLEDDNNFVASDIDSITEEKYSVTEIQDTKVEELSQPVLTFAKDK